MESILTDKSQVVGHIYLIERIGKKSKYYVGQAVSHRKNHGKYRLFGYEGRFRDHISEALCNTKKKQCWYLNNAIRRYGKDAFNVSLLETCALTDMDEREQYYIQEYNSLYPNGYNLTTGGKVFKTTDTPTMSTQLSTPKKRGGCTERSAETRQKMSTSLKAAFQSDETRTTRMLQTQQQHYEKKLQKFKGIDIDSTNLDQYICIRNSKEVGQYIRVKVGSSSVNFVGKYETIETLQERAINFLNQVCGNASKLTGNP